MDCMNTAGFSINMYKQVGFITSAKIAESAVMVATFFVAGRLFGLQSVCFLLHPVSIKTFINICHNVLFIFLPSLGNSKQVRTPLEFP